MDNYTEQIIGEFERLSGQILSGQIRVGDVPVRQLMDIVRVLFDRIGVGDRYSDTYGDLLSRFAASDDAEGFISTIRLIEYDIRLTGIHQETIGESLCREKTLRVRLSYYQNLVKNRKWHDEHPTEIGETYFAGRGCVYTVITGDYDEVIEPEYITDGMDHILFTNNPAIKSDIWEVRALDNPERLDDRYLSRAVKLLMYKYLPEYDYSVYVDGSIRVKGDVREFIDRYHVSEPMLCFNHTKNESIYQEGEDCKKAKKDSAETIDLQMKRYREAGFPENYGIFGGGVLTRSHHDDRLNSIMDSWWNELRSGSIRDQLSFNYVCWKHDFIYDSCDLVLPDNEYFEYIGHRG